jgi:hypothetical protein
MSPYNFCGLLFYAVLGPKCPDGIVRKSRIKALHANTTDGWRRAFVARAIRICRTWEQEGRLRRDTALLEFRYPAGVHRIRIVRIQRAERYNRVTVRHTDSIQSIHTKSRLTRVVGCNRRFEGHEENRIIKCLRRVAAAQRPASGLPGDRPRRVVRPRRGRAQGQPGAGRVPRAAGRARRLTPALARSVVYRCERSSASIACLRTRPQR